MILLKNKLLQILHDLILWSSLLLVILRVFALKIMLIVILTFSEMDGSLLMHVEMASFLYTVFLRLIFLGIIVFVRIIWEILIRFGLIGGDMLLDFELTLAFDSWFDLMIVFYWLSVIDLIVLSSISWLNGSCRDRSYLFYRGCRRWLVLRIWRFRRYRRCDRRRYYLMDLLYRFHFFILNNRLNYLFFRLLYLNFIHYIHYLDLRRHILYYIPLSPNLLKLNLNLGLLRRKSYQISTSYIDRRSSYKTSISYRNFHDGSTKENTLHLLLVKSSW